MTRRAWCPPLLARHDAPNPDAPATLRQRVLARGLAADDDDANSFDSGDSDSPMRVFEVGDEEGASAARPAQSDAVLEALQSPTMPMGREEEEASIQTLLDMQSEVNEILREAQLPVPEDEVLPPPPPAYDSLAPRPIGTGEISREVSIASDDFYTT